MNGWTNWATWNVALWIGNVESTYRARCRAIGADSTEADVERFVRETYPSGTPDMDGPADLADVDYGELLEHWRAE